MKILSSIKSTYSNNNDDASLKLLFSDVQQQTKEEVVYRKNGKSVDKIVEVDIQTGSKIKTTHYDYFNDKKIRSIDEYDIKTGKKIRTINYVLYKSIDEFDINSGKKVRTINFNVKDESKISSIQEYDVETGKIVTVSIFKRDGKTVSIVKKINPQTGKITSWINDNSNKIATISTRSYENIVTTRNTEEDIANLIDNLYSNNLKFENI